MYAVPVDLLLDVSRAFIFLAIVVKRIMQRAVRH